MKLLNRKYKHLFNLEWFEEHKVEIIGNLQDIHSMLDKCIEKENEVILKKWINMK
mgnify:CR=1 FL=1